MSRESIVQNATVVRVWNRLQAQLESAAKDARTVQLARSFLGTESESDSGGEDAKTMFDNARVQHIRTQFSQASQGARIYRLTGAGKRLVCSSWLYRWLTAEPEPDVIVIDLRKTGSAGPILAKLEWGIRTITPSVPTSGLLRLGYLTRERFLERPVRFLSFGIIIFVLITFAIVAGSGDELGPAPVLLFGLLIAALRGTQSTRTWDSITDTRWYDALSSAFEPPEPPDRPDDGDP